VLTCLLNFRGEHSLFINTNTHVAFVTFEQALNIQDVHHERTLSALEKPVGGGTINSCQERSASHPATLKLVSRKDKQVTD